jgi:hypothetical protein
MFCWKEVTLSSAEIASSTGLVAPCNGFSEGEAFWCGMFGSVLRPDVHAPSCHVTGGANP